MCVSTLTASAGAAINACKVADYPRVSVQLASVYSAWVYIKA
ncbi:hypothetical protein [Pseudomonas sp. dw_358]|nr:hypothetical protein [Pseudomonas sp. dw_358]